MLTNDEKGCFYYNPNIQMGYFVVAGFFFVKAQHIEPVFQVLFSSFKNSISSYCCI